MENILDTIVLNNLIKDYLIVAAVILLALIAKKRASKNITRLVFRLFRKMGRQINEKEFFDLVLMPLENFFFFLVVYLTLDGLSFPELFKIKILRLNVQVLLDRLAIGMLIIFFFHTLLRIIDYLAVVLEKKARITDDLTDDQLVIFFREFFKAILIIICILVLIRFVFGQDITKLLAGLSIVGAAIALAAKESLENLIASFIIFFDKPFAVGEMLKLNQVSGTVEKIGLRSTRIRTTDKTYVTIPNKMMVDTIVDNISQRNRRRVELMLHIDLTTSRKQLDDLIVLLQTELSISALLEKTIVFSDIRPDSFLITIEYFTEMDEVASFNEVRQKVNLTVLKVLEQEKILLAGKDKMIGLKVG